MLNNFAVVSRAPLLVRAAQPDRQGYIDLRDNLGVRTVFKLNPELPVTGVEGLVIETVRVDPFDPDPAQARALVDEISEALKIGGVLIHCTHGRDRTGAVVGAFRVLAQGWTGEAAAAEMKLFGAVGFFSVADHEIFEFLKRLKAA